MHWPTYAIITTPIQQQILKILLATIFQTPAQSFDGFWMIKH
jgi:hypothetical protein